MGLGRRRSFFAPLISTSWGVFSIQAWARFTHRAVMAFWVANPTGSLGPLGTLARLPLEASGSAQEGAMASTLGSKSRPLSFRSLGSRPLGPVLAAARAAV